LAYATLAPATWATIRYAIGTGLLERGDRIAFGHDYMRIAVSDRYLAGNGEIADEGQSQPALRKRREAHVDLANWFTAQAFGNAPDGQPLVGDARAVEEIPHQWLRARDWKRLKACLTQRTMFEGFRYHSDEYDQLAYWLELEGNTKTRLENAYNEAWEKWQPDPDDTATGDLAYAMSSFLRTAGRTKNGLARSCAELALSISEKSFGPDAPDTGYSLNNLAGLLRAKGDYAAAEPLFRRALAIAEHAQGPDHPDTGTRLNNLADLLEAQGDYASALPLYRRALAIAEKVQGAISEDVATRTNNLGVLLRNAGQFDKAQIELDSALRKWDALGDELGKASTLSALGKLWADKGDAVKARTEYEACLAIRERLLPEDDPSIALVRSRLAELDE
jgi:tetratricopeptide (TPR) repeat protein